MARRAGLQITREDIVEAASKVLARDGYDALTMRVVAAEIGVKAASLYWHVRNKDELSLLLFDHLIDHLDYGPPTGDWRADLRRMAERLRDRLLETRDITRLFPENYGAGPRAVRSLDLALGLLRQSGLPAGEALHAYGVALSFIVGWCRFEVARRGALGPSAPPMGVEALPNLAWALSRGQPDPGESFHYGIDLLLAGLAQRLEPSSAVAP